MTNPFGVDDNNWRDLFKKPPYPGQDPTRYTGWSPTTTPQQNLYDDARYYSGREVAGNAESDRAYGQYQQDVAGLAGETGAAPFQYDDFRSTVGAPTAPARTAGPEYSSAYGNGAYGDVTGPDLSQYADKSYYTASDQIDPNSSLGRALAMYEGSLGTTRDYAGAYRELAGAANDRLTSTIKDRTRDLESTAAGRGRLSSSVFDEDAGSLYRGLAEDTRATLSSGALNALGLQQAEDASRRSGYGNLYGDVLSTMNLNRQSALATGQAAAGAATSAAELAARNRAAQRAGYASDRDFRESQFVGDRTFEEARYEDRRDTERHNYESDRGFDYGVYGDAETRRENNQKFRAGLYTDRYKAAEDRSKTAYDEATGAKHDYLDWVTGVEDRKQAKKNAKGGTFGQILNAGATIAAKAAV